MKSRTLTLLFLAMVLVSLLITPYLDNPHDRSVVDLMTAIAAWFVVWVKTGEDDDV